MGANKFEIVISAVDKASKPIAQINRSMERMVRPINQVTRSAKNLGRELHLDKVARGVSGATRIGAGLTSGLGMPATSLGRVFSGAGLVSAGVGIASGVARLAADLGQSTRRIAQVSQRTNVDNQDVQRYRGAASLAGLNDSALDEGLINLADITREAAVGSSQDAANLFQRINVKPIMRSDGTADIASMLPQLARAASIQGNPATAAAVLNRMGLGSLFPLLRQGPEKLEALAKKAEEFGVVLDDKGIKSMTQFDQAMSELQVKLKGLTNAVALNASGPLTRFVEGLGNDLDVIRRRHLEAAGVHPFFSGRGGRYGGRGASGGWGSGPVPSRSDGPQNAPSADVSASLFQRFMGHGWSAAQAAGIVANLYAESSLSPDAVSPDGGAYGLAQWRRDRQDKFKAWSGKDIVGSSLNEQADFVNHELTNGTEQAAGRQLRLTTTADAAARVVSKEYERPPGGDDEAARRAGLIDHEQLGRAIVAALRSGPLQVTVKGGMGGIGGGRVGYAMPADGIR